LQKKISNQMEEKDTDFAKKIDHVGGRFGRQG